MQQPQQPWQGTTSFTPLSKPSAQEKGTNHWSVLGRPTFLVTGLFPKEKQIFFSDDFPLSKILIAVISGPVAPLLKKKKKKSLVVHSSLLPWLKALSVILFV